MVGHGATCAAWLLNAVICVFVARDGSWNKSQGKHAVIVIP